jgi:uncharacterized repeat protein (TIGR02543 family)
MAEVKYINGYNLKDATARKDIEAIQKDLTNRFEGDVEVTFTISEGMHLPAGFLDIYKFPKGSCFFDKGWCIPNPYKSGYRFLGWYKTENSQYHDTENFSATMPIWENITLYAAWEKLKYDFASDDFELSSDGTYLTLKTIKTYGSNNYHYYCYRRIVIPNEYEIDGVSYPVKAIAAGEDYVSRGCHIKEVTIGANVETIGNYAFSGHYGIEKVTIPVSVKTIGYGAFVNTQAFDIYYQGTMAQWAEVDCQTYTSGYSTMLAFLLHSTIHCTDGDILFEH